MTDSEILCHIAVVSISGVPKFVLTLFLDKKITSLNFRIENIEAESVMGPHHVEDVTLDVCEQERDNGNKICPILPHGKIIACSQLLDVSSSNIAIAHSSRDVQQNQATGMAEVHCQGIQPPCVCILLLAILVQM